ncbi:MAG: porin [Burkholderiaceae bacterium]
MKKSLLALAVLGSFAGVASAQSSVTLFGIVDLSARQVKNGSNNALKTMATDGINSSRLGFRGVEDLGGGLSAGFWLEAGMDNGLGAVGGSNSLASVFFNRRSTVSLMGRFGEIRLGRDYTSGFWNTTVFDPFGTNGVGAFTNLSINASLESATYVRSNNTVGYFLPGNLGGLYGQVQRSASEGILGQQQTSGRIGFAAGPVNVAASHQITEKGANDWKHSNIAGSWNFGFMNLMAQYDTQKLAAVKQNTYLIGAVVPIGQGELHVSYDKQDRKGGAAGTSNENADDADQIAVGYVYNLSKRTAVYGTYAQIKNKGGAANGSNQLIPGGVGNAVGAKSTGVEVGLRHAF